jgi:N-acetylmuramoyl-L-alanine amidase
MIVADAPSPNFGPRAASKKIKYLILHYTGTPTGFEALRLLQGGDPTHEVSAHYFIDEAGAVTRIVDESMRAWHAGKSSWEGEEDINSCSIGIEIQNPGHEYGYVPFPDVQMKSVAELCRDIISRHALLPNHILAHSDIAPLRKKDPGELFPWQALTAQGIGLWPEVTDSDQEAAGPILQSPEEVKSILTCYGYDARCDLKTLVTAFQRHYEPEAFLTPLRIGTTDLDTVSRMQAIMRQKLGLRPKINYS